MKKLIYTPDYKKKVLKLRKYLDLHFGEKVCKEKMQELNKRIQSIRENDNIGISVQDMFGIACDYRFIYVVKNYVFYAVREDGIHIVDIYDEREDYMRKMFGINTTSQETEDYWGE